MHNCALVKNLQNLNFMATNTFFKYLKLGYVDLTQIDRFFNGQNCLLVNIGFASYMYTHGLDLQVALLEFTQKRGQFSEFMSINTATILAAFKQQGLVASIEHISKQINRPIVIISKSKTVKKHNEVVYISTNKHQYALKTKMPIYLLFEKDHVCFAYNFKLKPNSTFCYICIRNVRNGYHNCKKKMCRLCCRYISSKSENHTQDVCHSMNISDTSIACTTCNNIFTNESCFKMHSTLKRKRKFCLDYYRCSDCSQFVRNGDSEEHIHNNRFCSTCKKYHKNDSICYISGMHFNKIKSKNDYKFLSVCLTLEGNPLFGIVSDINSGNCWTKVYLTNTYNGTDKSSIELGDKLSLTSIVNYLQGCKKGGRSMYIWCDRYTLNCLLSQIDSELTELSFGRHGTVSGFTVLNLHFRTLEGFIDLKPHIIAYLLNENMAKVVLPRNLTEATILANEWITVDNTNYDIQSYIGSKREHYDQLKVDINNISELSAYAADIFIQMSEFTFSIYLNSIFKLIEFYNSIKTKLSLKSNSFMLEHNSLAMAGNYLYRSMLANDSLPVINANMSNYIKNSSRIEFCTVELLKRLHQLTCKHRPSMSSLITNNGQQFKINQYSADFHCSSCKTMYFINGAYKVDTCQFGHKHNLSHTFFGKSKTELASEFKSNLDIIINLTNNKLEPVIFNECCIKSKNKIAIKRHILTQLIKYKVPKAKLITVDLLADYKKLLKNYTTDKYKSIDYRHCVDLPFVTFVKPYFRLNEKRLNHFSICKYDMKSAYPNQLKNILLPYQDAGVKFVFDEANHYFNTLISSGRHTQVTGFCRALITPSINEVTKICPFFAYKHGEGDSSEYSFTLCRTCSINRSNYATCVHTDTERSFYVNTTICSLVFANVSLNYSVILTQLIVYERCKKYTEFSDVFNAIETLRQHNKFYKHFGKSICLQGIGSFSLNVDKYSSTKSLSTYASLAAQLTAKPCVVKNYAFVGDENPHCMVELDNKPTFRKFVSPHINTLIYTLCSNSARVHLYKTLMLIVQKFPDSNILRLDSDAVTLSVLNSDRSAINALFKQQCFQLEQGDIQAVVSFKNRSYLTLDANTNSGILKTCGLSIPLAERFQNLDYDALSTDYISNIDKLKSASRIICPQVIKHANYQCIESHPYGLPIL